MPSPEESNAAMAIISTLQAEYAGGGYGLPPGADWVESAFAYMEHGGIYADEAQARDLLEGYGLLSMPPPAEPPSFEEALDHPQWWADLRAHIETEFSTENPDFVDAVRNQSLDPQAIYDTFVQEGSPREVNVPAAMRKPIDEAFAADEAPGYDVFDSAYAEICNLIRRDSWPRFLAKQAAG